MKKPSVYIETSVISYLCSQPSRDIVVAGHQQTTKEWWTLSLPKLTPYVSDIVIKEISKGNIAQAKLRIEAIQGFKKLELNPSIEKLATQYFSKLNIPEKAFADVFHLAVSVIHNIDFLVSWNCAHIANAHVIRDVIKLNSTLKLNTPVICTPEELKEE